MKNINEIREAYKLFSKNRENTSNLIFKQESYKNKYPELYKEVIYLESIADYLDYIADLISNGLDESILFNGLSDEIKEIESIKSNIKDDKVVISYCEYLSGILFRINHSEILYNSEIENKEIENQLTSVLNSTDPSWESLLNKNENIHKMKIPTFKSEILNNRIKSSTHPWAFMIGLINVNLFK